eukprot:CAMPEP_0185554056 /NCGR_PEP_ID=MMETSP1381-20130426/39982_1 /TAXON_ID=298111 /ORGANISM="Pavlova sp., Strain CCMP459" /LENGTH=142 /DNA_ID=CAMNT_0028167223 /DNA_START=191 /DNA_END=620 /DNA_ORIENTATION=-
MASPRTSTTSTSSTSPLSGGQQSSISKIASAGVACSSEFEIQSGQPAGSWKEGRRSRSRVRMRSGMPEHGAGVRRAADSRSHIFWQMLEVQMGLLRAGPQRLTGPLADGLGQPDAAYRSRYDAACGCSAAVWRASCRPCLHT